MGEFLAAALHALIELQIGVRENVVRVVKNILLVPLIAGQPANGERDQQKYAQTAIVTRALRHAVAACERNAHHRDQAADHAWPKTAEPGGCKDREQIEKGIWKIEAFGQDAHDRKLREQRCGDSAERHRITSE